MNNNLSKVPDGGITRIDQNLELLRGLDGPITLAELNEAIGQTSLNIAN